MKKISGLMLLVALIVAAAACAKKTEDVMSEEEKALEMTKTAIASVETIKGTKSDNYNGTVTENISSPYFSGSATVKYNAAKGSLENAVNPGDVTEASANLTLSNYSFGGIVISGSFTMSMTGSFYYDPIFEDILSNSSPAVWTTTFNMTVKQDGVNHTLYYSIRFEYDTLVSFTLQVDGYSFSYSDFAKSTKRLSKLVKGKLFNF